MSTFSSSSGDGGHTLGFGSRSAGAEEKIEVSEVAAAAGAEEKIEVSEVAAAAAEEKIEVSEVAAAAAEEKIEVSEVAAAAAATTDAAGATTAVVDGGNRNMQDRRGMKLPGATRDWSSLPKPAIQLILMRLRPSLVDSFSFAGVCKEWRSVYIDCKRQLFSSLPPLLIDCYASGRFYSLFDRGFFYWKPPIPSRLLGAASGSLYGSDWYVIGVSHGYWVIMKHPLGVMDSERIPGFLLLDPLFPESRIELPPAPHFRLEEYRHALMTAPPTSPGCVVVVTETYSFWYCRPGDTEWVHHDFRHEFNEDFYLKLRHVAVLGRELYAVASSGRKVVVVELLFPRPRVTVMDVEGLNYSFYDLFQFVESAGEVLYIADDADWRLSAGGCKHRFIVRRLDLPARRWVTLDTLGKRSIFLPQYKKFRGCLGTPVTCIGGAAEWGGREDCIYKDCSNGTLMVWNMKDGSVEHHPLPEERHSWEWLVPSFCYA